MALHVVLSSMQLDDGSTTIIEVNAKAADYFGIVEVTPKMKVVEKKAYTYQRGGLSSSDTGHRVEVPASRYTVAPRQGKRNNRKIRVPREEVSARGNQRTFSFSFPKRARNWEISQWLWQHCNRHKPLYFVTEAGAKHGVWDYSNEAMEPDY